MIYLLDTNACIAVIEEKPPSVRAKFYKVLQDDSQILVPSIVAFELWYGVEKSAHREANARRATMFLAGPIRVVPFEEEDAIVAGAIRATLETSGKPIGAYDLLIAAQALRLKATLVTANVSEFRRVKDLAWEDWVKS